MSQALLLSTRHSGKMLRELEVRLGELVEYAVNIDFEPFTWGVRSLYKPGPE